MIYTVKKYVNFRLPVIIACALAIGTTAGLLFGYYKTDLIWLTAFIPAAAVPIIIATAVFKNFKPLAFIILALIFLYAGALNGILRLEAYGKNNIDVSENKTYSISGTVKEKSAFSSGEYIIVTDVSANGTKLKYDIIVYLGNSYGDFCDNGNKVKFKSSLTLRKIILNTDAQLTAGLKADNAFLCSVKYAPVYAKHCSITLNMKPPRFATVCLSAKRRLLTITLWLTSATAVLRIFLPFQVCISVLFSEY